MDREVCLEDKPGFFLEPMASQDAPEEKVGGRRPPPHRSFFSTLRNAKFTIFAALGAAAVATMFCMAGVFKLRRAPLAFVVIEMRRKDKGPPLLPVADDGWEPFSSNEPYTLSQYLCELLQRITGTSWDEEVYQQAGSQRLHCWQAAVSAESWKLIFDALVKPYELQRVAYRKFYHCRNAPELYFGTEPRFVEDSSSSSRSSYSSCWSCAIPVRRTFVHFDGEGLVLPRSQSTPDLQSTFGVPSEGAPEETAGLTENHHAE
jgi:hypothetical protein